MRRTSWICTLVAALELVPSAASARPCRLRSPASRCQPEVPRTGPQYPPPRGLPILIFGAGLFAFGIPTAFVGTTLVLHPDRGAEGAPGVSSLGPNAGLHFLIPAIVMITSGVTLTAVGAVRFDRFLRWRRQWSLTPTAGRSPAGAFTAGLTVRF